jgi:hypothetical protein
MGMAMIRTMGVVMSFVAEDYYRDNVEADANTGDDDDEKRVGDTCIKLI